MRKPGLLCLGLVGALFLAACAPDLILTYNSLAARVDTDCGDYAVGDNIQLRSLLLTSYASSAVKRPFCEGRKVILAKSTVTGLTAQEGAEDYLYRYRSEECRITGGRSVDPIHTEFTYDCPVDPKTGALAARKIPLQ